MKRNSAAVQRQTVFHPYSFPATLIFKELFKRPFYIAIFTKLKPYSTKAGNMQL